jgi:hypothetical protein
MRYELERFLEACDPATPAAGERERARRFVDRKDGFRVELAVRLRQKGAHVLCVGQTGTGKTTELLKVAEELQTQFVVVVPPLDRDLDLSLLGWHDVMVFGCLWAAAHTKALEDSDAVRRLIGIIGGEKTQPPTGAVTQVTMMPPPRIHGVATEGKIPAPSAFQKFRNEHQKIKERIAKGPAQVADLCRQAVAEIEKKAGRPLVVLLDGLEKVTVEVARRLFYEEARLALDLPFRAAVVAPHALLHQEYSADLSDSFSGEPLVLRAISCQRDEPEGRRFFTEMIRSRGGTDLLEAEAMELAIDACGGIPRQLLTIACNAASLAIAQDASSITSDLMIRGRERAMERFFYALRDDDYRDLREFAEDRLPEPRRERLLRLLAVIEYGKVGSFPRLGVNPLCNPLVKRYEASHPREAIPF